MAADMKTSLQFARLLNKARLFLVEYVNACSECKEGKIAYDSPTLNIKKGDPCPHCLELRQFLEQCTKEAGPIVETPA